MTDLNENTTPLAAEAMIEVASAERAEPTYTERDIQASRDLFEMFTYGRHDGSKMERKFIKKFLEPLDVTRDGEGNVIKRIDHPDGSKSVTLWSSHTDTVHNVSRRQKVCIRNGKLRLATGEHRSSCLGADDTVGVWIMREMILANVPGLYIFHRGEEVGCRGSRHIRNKSPELLDGIKYAVAFDRRGTRDVITHQCGTRCCSDDFAKSLAAFLGGGYKPSQNGMFTDTRHYASLVGECTNISVGYYDAHGSSESLDCVFAFNLMKKMLTFDESRMVEKRKACETEYGYSGGYGGFGDDWSSWRRGESGFDANDYDLAHGEYGVYRRPNTGAAYPTPSKHRPSPWSPRVITSSSDGRNTVKSKRFYDIQEFITYNPGGVADFLDQQGVDVDELREWTMKTMGFIRGPRQYR